MDVFVRPPELDDAVLVDRLSGAWGLRVDEISYQPVGFGSHHWVARTADDSWFVTVDDLDSRLLDDHDDRVTASARLVAAVSTVTSLRESGHRWAVAPRPATSGRLVEPLDERFVAAVYPFVEGVTSPHGHYDDADERRAVVSVLAELHGVEVSSTPVHRHDHTIPRRSELEEAMRGDRPRGRPGRTRMRHTISSPAIELRSNGC